MSVLAAGSHTKVGVVRLHDCVSLNRAIASLFLGRKLTQPVSPIFLQLFADEKLVVEPDSLKFWDLVRSSKAVYVVPECQRAVVKRCLSEWFRDANGHTCLAAYWVHAQKRISAIECDLELAEACSCVRRHLWDNVSEDGSPELKATMARSQDLLNKFKAVADELFEDLKSFVVVTAAKKKLEDWPSTKHMAEASIIS